MSSRVFLYLSLAGLALLVPSCFDNKPKETLYELVGSEKERVEAMTKILLREIESLPSPIKKPYLLEIKIGDGRMGPSDFRTFSTFQVDPTTLDKWVALLGDPIDPPFPLDTPSQERFWWLSPETASTRTFYSGKALSGRFQSWATVDPDEGRIYVFSLTM